MGTGTKRPGRSLIDKIFNCLTTFVFLTILLIGGLFAAIYINPRFPFNPFPPPTDRPTSTAIPPTRTSEITLPTFSAQTDEPTNSAFVTQTIEPPLSTQLTQTTEPSSPASSTKPIELTLTPEIVFTPTKTPPVATSIPTAVPFSLLPGTPVYTQNFLNDLGCAWMGVAGQVIAGEEGGTLDVWVKLGGQLEGSPIDMISLPGSAPGYGGGGYEFVLGDEPIASENLIWIQLIDPSEHPLSDKIYLETSDSCEENLLIVSWESIE